MSVATKLQIRPTHSVATHHQPDGVDLGIPPDQPTGEPADAVVVFVANRSDLEARARPFIEAARRDALAWIAYPKAGQLGTDLNRDILWELLGDEGIRPVRQVAIDGTWSALRFRPA